MRLKATAIAIVCHEANRAYCAGLGDYSQKPWAESPDWQKESAIKGVEFHLNNPWADEDSSHNSWLQEKEATGWKYGPVKDEAKKEHPCYVPFHDLPKHQQYKDRLFKNIVNSLREA